MDFEMSTLELPDQTAIWAGERLAEILVAGSDARHAAEVAHRKLVAQTAYRLGAAFWDAVRAGRELTTRDVAGGPDVFVLGEDERLEIARSLVQRAVREGHLTPTGRRPIWDDDSPDALWYGGTKQPM